MNTFNLFSVLIDSITIPTIKNIKTSKANINKSIFLFILFIFYKFTPPIILLNLAILVPATYIVAFPFLLILLFIFESYLDIF